MRPGPTPRPHPLRCRQRLRRRGARRPRRPAARRRGGSSTRRPSARSTATSRARSAARTRPAGAARAAAGRAVEVLRPAPRLLARRAPDARSATRPTCSSTATSRSPTATSGSSTGSTDVIPTRACARSARTPAARPCSSSAGAWAGSCRCSRSPPTPELPVSSGALVASPFDSRRCALMSRRAPDRRESPAACWAARSTGSLGGAPAPLVKRGFQLDVASTST